METAVEFPDKVLFKFVTKEDKRLLVRYLKREDPEFLNFLAMCGKEFGELDHILMPASPELSRFLNDK